ncbi:unnamed protein product, partial [Trichogramma brassicae]
MRDSPHCGWSGPTLLALNSGTADPCAKDAADADDHLGIPTGYQGRDPPPRPHCRCMYPLRESASGFLLRPVRRSVRSTILAPSRTAPGPGDTPSMWTPLSWAPWVEWDDLPGNEAVLNRLGVSQQSLCCDDEAIH